MNKCVICADDFENMDVKVVICSRECSYAFQLLEAGEQLLTGTRPTEDTRIFFFPQSFGKLCDIYCVLSLRRAHTRSIGAQQEVDYRISKMRKSLTTLLGQLFFDEKQREKMRIVLTDLFQTNAKIWAAKDRARNVKYDVEVRKEALWDTLQESDKRHGLIQQLDILHSGKTHTYKVYNSKES